MREDFHGRLLQIQSPRPIVTISIIAIMHSSRCTVSISELVFPHPSAS